MTLLAFISCRLATRKYSDGVWWPILFSSKGRGVLCDARPVGDRWDGHTCVPCPFECDLQQRPPADRRVEDRFLPQSAQSHLIRRHHLPGRYAFIGSGMWVELNG